MLHLGITKSRNGEIEEAVEWLKKAEQESLQLDDTLKYDVALALGDLNQQENCQVLAKRHYQNAYLLAKQTGNRERQAQSLCKLIRTADKDSTSKYIDICKGLLPHVDSPMRSEILGCLGNWALQKNQKDLALQYLQEATATFPNDFAALQLGNLYEKDGDTKKACELWFEALNTNNDDVRVAALEKLIPHYKDAETWRALDLSQMLNDLLKKHHSIDQTEHIAALQEQFDHNIIREKLIKSDLIEAVVTLGDKLFYGTGLSPCFLILRRIKKAEHSSRILMVDGSKILTPRRAQNILTTEDVDRLYELYTSYTDKEGYSKVVTLKDIEGKDWNLSPNRYIDYHKEDARPYSEVLQEFKDALLAVQEAEAEFRSIINS